MRPSETPLWEQRYRAPDVWLPQWSPHAPDRLTYTSTESGSRQLHAWDRSSGRRRRVTDDPVGVRDGAPTPEGDAVVWFQDDTGDEAGRWLVQAFAGGDVRPLLDGTPKGWNEGFAQTPGVTAAAISDRDGFAIYVSTNGSTAVELYRSNESLRLGVSDAGGFNRAGLSSDGSLLCVVHSEHGDLLHPALRALDARTGTAVGEQADPGMALDAACWSPVPGDQRLAITHERHGEERPAVWNVSTGIRNDLDVDLPGVVTALDWWPDASALLVINLRDGRDRLFRYDIATAELHPVQTPEGTVHAARVRPDGSVWYRQSQGDRRPLILDDRGEVVLSPQGPAPPPGRPYVSWEFQNQRRQRVHGFYVPPPGDGRRPVIMFVHGGPTSLDTDAWDPEVQAYVDAGFAVGMVNYRGSVGYGREWRDAIVGNVGGPELEDVNAGLADLVAKGIADPRRAVIAGWSWGGYVTLMELGKHPELWVCGVAGVPVGDYEASYADMSPLLQAYDRALLGGAPQDVPELMRDRNPIYFADRVEAPVLFLAGENDSRCPIRQVMLYVDRLKARGHPHEVYLYSTGHSSFDIDEKVRQQRVVLDFLARHVPGV